MNIVQYQSAVDSIPFGKCLPTARYVFAPDESSLPPPLASFVGKLRKRLGLSGEFNVLKFSSANYALSFLRYPDFLTVPHPVLAESVRVQLAAGSVKRTDFTSHSNRPILHRKECFLPPGHPKRSLFAALTRAEEAAGLYEEASHIGFRDNWQQLLREKGLQFRGHKLILLQLETDSPAREEAPAIHRHRTAIVRNELSKPVRVAMEFGLLKESDTFFDYGCGLGSDVTGLRAMGVQASGWDPAYFSNEPKCRARVVNLGFVLNVIEKPAERVSVLQAAWNLAEGLLLVSTLVRGQEDYTTIRPHADGYLTSRSTFQKILRTCRTPSSHRTHSGFRGLSGRPRHLCRLPRSPRCSGLAGTPHPANHRLGKPQPPSRIPASPPPASGHRSLRD